MIIKSITVWITVLLLLAGCHHAHKDTHQHDSTGEHVESSGHSHDNEIVFTREQAEAVGLTTEQIVPATFHNVIKTSGRIESAQGDEAMVVATTDGVVSFTNPSITEGLPVRAGESIATLSAKHLQDGDPATRARIEFDNAQIEFQRAEELVKDQIISEKEFEQIRLRYETVKAAYDAHASNLSPEGVRVVSPISGYIANRMVAQGEYVSVGQPIATITRNNRLHLRAEVPESHFPQLKNISTAHFKTAYSDRLFKLSDLNGRLISYGKSVKNSFFLPITFEFENHADILSGSYTEVYLISTPLEKVLSIPITAISEEQGLYFAYLQLDEDHYEKQEIMLGQSDGERTEVVSGLKEGDRVVTKGVTQVKLAAVASVMPEGHSHSH